MALKRRYFSDDEHLSNDEYDYLRRQRVKYMDYDDDEGVYINAYEDQEDNPEEEEAPQPVMDDEEEIHDQSVTHYQEEFPEEEVIDQSVAEEDPEEDEIDQSVAEEDPEEDEIDQSVAEEDPEEDVIDQSVAEEDPEEEEEEPLGASDEEGSLGNEDTEFELVDEEIEEQERRDKKEDEKYYNLISNTKKNPFNHSVVYSMIPKAVRSWPVGMEIKTTQTVVTPDMVRTERLRRGINRLWYEDDEITILKGMIQYNWIKERYPNGNDDLGDFYDFIKNFIHIDVTRIQLYNKIGKLKLKYQKNKEKTEVENAVDLYMNPHTEELFMLSDKIWGVKHDCEEEEEEEEGDGDNEATNDYGVSANSAGKENAEEEEDFWSMYPRLNESLKLKQFSEYTMSSFVKQRMTCIGNLKAKELEEKWRKLQVVESKVKLMRAQLVQEQTELILNCTS